MKTSGAPVDEPEVADVERHLHLGDPVEAPVEPGRRRALEPRLTVALVAHGVDDVVALTPARGELEHDLGRILQVGVEHDHRVARGQVDAGGQRDLVAEVPRQLDQLEPRVVLRRRRKQLVGAVSAPVVDDDRFGIADRRVHQLAEAGDEFVDDAFLVVCRDDQ